MRVPDPPEPKDSRRVTAAWAAAAAVTVVAAGLIPLLHEPRYYFHGDTQSAYFGWWYELGGQVLSGNWPMLDLQSWRAGNFISEGQWGLFSPLTILIGVASTLATDVVVFTTVVKIGILVVTAVGTFLLTRSYGVHPAAAFVAGVAVPLGGETQYLEWPSWVNGQFVIALLPWAWWGLRRIMISNKNPWPALLAGYLVVTVGYVYGTVYLAVVIVGCLAEALLMRNRGAAIRVFVVGLCVGLVAVTVYLPGVLTSPVTIRDSWEVLSDGRLQADVAGLMASMLPTGLSPAAGGLPVHYIAWFLPFLAWVDQSRVRRELRSLSGVVVVLAIMGAWAVGPNQLGPIRWPVRVMPVVALAVVVLSVVLFARTVRFPPSARRLTVSLLLVLAPTYLVVSRYWETKRMQFMTMVLVMVAVAVVWALFRLWARMGTIRPLGGAGTVAITIAVGCLGVIAAQHHYYPQPPSLDRNMPSQFSDYTTQLQQAEGDVMLLGDPQDAAVRNPSVTEELLIASSWFLNPHQVQSTYTTIGFRAYTEHFCVKFNGSTCAKALTRLFRKESVTGQKRIDLLSVSTLVFFRKDFSQRRLRNPPEGWHVADNSKWSLTWVRDEPLPTAGKVVWTSPGTEVTDLASVDRRAEFRVDDVPPGGGTVVLSRLAWPGYAVEGGSLPEPVDDYLLTVQVPEESVGRSVLVRYSPPGWTLEIACWILGVGLALVWSVAHLWSRRRRRFNEVSRTESHRRAARADTSRSRS